MYLSNKDITSNTIDAYTIQVYEDNKSTILAKFTIDNQGYRINIISVHIRNTVFLCLKIIKYVRASCLVNPYKWNNRYQSYSILQYFK